MAQYSAVIQEFLFTDTCHFQKLNAKEEDTRRRSSGSSSSNGTGNSIFDFHWNTSPTSVVCAFPYIFGFTSDTMEIRFLVNGNLVHTEMLPELQLITSKRDIFYVTTSPEFMPNTSIPSMKDRQAQIEELLTTKNQLSGRLISTSNSPNPSEHDEVNVTHSTGNHLMIPPRTDTCPIQRVRSLQKEKQVEKVPVILKSHSCGDSSTSVGGSDIINADSYRLKTDYLPTGPSHSSPSTTSIETVTDKWSNNTSGRQSPCSNGSGTVKPLRIYRIPLTKLTGTHAHFNMQSFSALATPRLINASVNVSKSAD